MLPCHASPILDHIVALPLKEIIDNVIVDLRRRKPKLSKLTLRNALEAAAQFLNLGRSERR